MERQIKGIFIPIEIWEDKTLSWNEKVLLMEIDSFTRQDLDCYFSNEYIADLLGVKVNTASLLVSSLIEKGYITRTRFDGRHRFIRSNLAYSVEGRLLQKSNAGFEKNQRQGLSKIKGSNIIDNNTYNKENNKLSVERFSKPSVDDVRAYCIERGNSVDAETFCDFYESKGWKVGTTPMKDWKAAVRTWERSRDGGKSRQQAQQPKSSFEKMMDVGRELGFIGGPEL